MRTEDRPFARSQVDVAKVALGERGLVWWNDGAVDYNRNFVRTKPYAEWFEDLPYKTLRRDTRGCGFPLVMLRCIQQRHPSNYCHRVESDWALSRETILTAKLRAGYC